MKWIWILLIGVCAFVAFVIISYDQSLRLAHLIKLKDALKSAQAEYQMAGAIRKHSSSVHVTLSTNSIVINSTNFQIFAEARGSFAPESTVAVTTNEIFILIQPNTPPRVVSPSHRTEVA